MDKKIIATPIPPDQPEAPRIIVRIAGISLIVGTSGSSGEVFGPLSDHGL